ncbi:UBA-like protein [Tanacetum coccineum]
MSLASKSKSKDKRVVGREPQKSSTKPTSITNTGGSVPTGGYNPLLGTFHALETKDSIGNSVGMGIEYDSLSNSGEGLAQQLVAMRFSYERATMAIILNKGKVEQSVAWLFEGGCTLTSQNRFTVMNMHANRFQHGPTTTRSFNTSSHINSVSNRQMYDHFHYQQQQQPHLQHQYASSIATLDHHFSQQGSMNHYNNYGMWNRMVGSTTTTTTPTLAHASSLGLFSGLRSNRCSGPSSPVGWNTLDHYALARGGKTSTRPPTGIMSNGNNGISVGGLHPDRVGAVGSETSAGGSRDWSSPFEEKELSLMLRWKCRAHDVEVRST